MNNETNDGMPNMDSTITIGGQVLTVKEASHNANKGLLIIRWSNGLVTTINSHDSSEPVKLSDSYLEIR